MKTSSFFLSTLIAAAAMSASAYATLTTYDDAQTLSEDLTFNQSNVYVYNGGLTLNEGITIQPYQTGSGYVTLFANGLSGAGNILQHRDNGSGGNQCVVWLTGDTAGFTGIIKSFQSDLNGTKQQGTHSTRVLLGTTSDTTGLDLSSATLYTYDTNNASTSGAFVGLGSNVTIGDFYANSNTQIDATTGVLPTFTDATIETNSATAINNESLSRTLSVAKTGSLDGVVIESGVSLEFLSGSTGEVTNGLTLKGGSLTNAGNLTLSGTISVGFPISNTGTVSVSSETVFALVSSSASDGVYSVINNSGNGTVEGWDSTTLGLSNFTIDGNALGGRSTLNLSGVGQVSITGTVASLVWNGGNSGTWDVETTQNWTNEGVADVFYSYDNVTFGTEATRKTVSINGDVVAGTVSIEDDYTFSATKNATLSSTGISVASGKTLTLSAASDTVLTITGATTGGANLVKSGSGTVNIANTGNSFSSVSVESGRLELGTNDDDSIKSFSVASGATLAIVAGNDMATWSGTIYNISGALEMNKARFSISGGTFNLNSGSISGAGDGRGALDFHGAMNTVNISGNSTISAKVRVRSGKVADFVIGENSTLNFSGEIIAGDETGGTMKKSGSGTMNFSGTISAGTLEVAAGAVNFSGTIGENGVVSVSKEAVLDYGKGASSLSASRVKGFGTIKYEFFKNSATTGTGSGLTTSADFSGTVDYTGCLNWTSGSGANIAQTVTIANDATTLRLSSVEGATSIMWGRGEKTLSNKIVFATNYEVGLGAGSLTLAGEVDAVGKTITISGGNNFCIGGNATIGALSGGNTKITAGGVLTLGQGVDAGADILSGSLNVANGGNVKLVGLLVSGVITAEEGAMVRIAVQNVNANEITLASGAKLVVDLADFASELATDADEVMLTILTGTTLRFGDVSAASSDILTSENLSYLSIEDSSGEFLDKYAGQKWSYDGSTLSLTLTIPEPSAFGLLAGVGALALVASRRRRK